jgi:hypothetical protein
MPLNKIKITMSREEALACIIGLDKCKPYHWRDLILRKLEKAMGLKAKE